MKKRDLIWDTGTWDGNWPIEAGEMHVVLAEVSRVKQEVLEYAGEIDRYLQKIRAAATTLNIIGERFDP